MHMHYVLYIQEYEYIAPANCEYLYYSSSSSRLLGVLLLETTLKCRCAVKQNYAAHIYIPSSEIATKNNFAKEEMETQCVVSKEVVRRLTHESLCDTGILPTYLPIPHLSQSTIPSFLTILCFFACGKKEVDGKNDCTTITQSAKSVFPCLHVRSPQQPQQRHKNARAVYTTVLLIIRRQFSSSLLVNYSKSKV